MLEAEFGSSHPIAQMKSTFFEGEPTPKCPQCGIGKTLILGRSAYQWICICCDDTITTQQVFRAAFLKNLLVD